MRRLLICSLAGLLLVAGVRAEEARTPVRIGVSAGVTGPYAAFGVQLKNGASQAIEDINKAGGLSGRKFEPVYGDDASDPKQGVSVAGRDGPSKRRALAGRVLP